MLDRRTLLRSVALSATGLPFCRAAFASALPSLPAVPQTRDSSSAATDPHGPTGALATWLASTTLNDVPQTTQERAFI